MKRVIYIRLFDLHCDTLSLGLGDDVSIDRHDGGAVDLQRGHVYSSWVQAFAAFIPDDHRDAAARQTCLSLLDVATRWERECADGFRIIRRRRDLNDDLVGCRALLTVEGLGAIGKPLSWLSELRERHVRAATLTWNGDNTWADGCFGSGGGLTALGRQALKQLERLGIIVDVSHLSESGFWDVARLSERPFIASHSNSASVFPHPRNLTDDQFRTIRDSGGIVGLNLYYGHLGVSLSGDYIEAFCRHLDHFLSLSGDDIVCIGSDFDGMEIPAEWNGMGFLQVLYQHLLSCGYDAVLLDKLFYTNARRFFCEALP